MRLTSHRPFVPVSVLDRLDRTRWRRAALRYAAQGWPVTPGARRIGHRFVCDRPGCPIMSCHPVLESWADTTSTDARQIGAWWRRRPYTVLLATGTAFDVLEVPAALGLRALGAARLHAGLLRLVQADARGPIAVTATGRWMFLVRPGTALRPELDHRLDVVRHGDGSWIPAPPSRLVEGPVRWAVPPERTGWWLPEAEAVQALLVDALGAVRLPRRTIPRQMTRT